MEINRYVKVFELDNEEYCLYNTTNGAIIRLEKSYIKNNEILVEKLSADEIESLSEFQIIKVDNMDIMNKLKEDYQNDSQMLVITIELTRKCNLYCTYCYENGLKNDNLITEAVMDQIIEYVDKVTKKKVVKILKVNFIGGEPLLAKKQLKYIYSNLSELCKKKGIDIYSLLNTNGVLLEKEFLSEFKNMEVSITLSNKEDHNEVRPFINGKGSYDLIVEKIKECKDIFDRDDISLCIRYNTNEKNYEKFPYFLDELKKLDVRIKQVEPMYTDEYEQNTFKNTLSKEAFLEWNSTVAIDALIKNGYKIHYKPQTILAPCKAYMRDNCKIYTDGNVGLCDASEYNLKGPNISEINKSDDLLNDHFKEIKSWTPFDDTKCRMCNDIILCGGYYFCRLKKCDYKRYNLESFIRKFVEYDSKGKGEYFVAM